RTFGGEAANDVDDGARIRTVPDEVAEKRVTRGAAIVRVLHASLERLEVGVEIGEEGERRFLLHVSHPALRALQWRDSRARRLRHQSKGRSRAAATSPQVGRDAV